MGTIEFNGKIKELRSLRRMADELAGEIEALQDAIKAEMTARNVDTLTGDDWKITWKEVTSNLLDATAQKKDITEIEAALTKAI